MRIQIVDPPAYTPPYDRSLCAALARAGAEVELVTSRFGYGGVPPADGYRVTELLYSRAAGHPPGTAARRALGIAEHLPGMLKLRRHAREADLVHFQWLTLPALDRLLLPAPTRPRVFTLHFPLPRRRRALGRQRALLGRMDAVIAHSEHAAARLRDEVGLQRGRVRVIPHGAFDYLARFGDERPLPEELRDAQGPVVLLFGLLRPYKGADVLLEAFRELEAAELWIVGRPMMALDPLRELAARCSGRVRLLPRFVPDAELAPIFRRADVVVLPYREVEQSGVLYTALAFGKPIVASSVGGFPEVGEQGAARLVPPGDPGALATALGELVEDAEARGRLAAAARAAASGPYSWDEVAARTIELYRELLERL